jgi:predicted transcriptional regulator
VSDQLGIESLSDSERRETIDAVKEGLADVAAGRTQPMRQALEELGRQHNIPRTP